MGTLDETLELVKTAQTKSSEEITKAFTQPSSATTGLQGYDLEAPAKSLYPVLTPLRNKIPRRGGSFATQANWKAITGVNTTNQRAGVSEGNRGGVISQTTAEYLAAYRAIGLENNVTFEADYASQGYEDLKALAVRQTLEATMIREEMMLLGGNTSLAMGTPVTPTLVNSASGGTLAAGTWSVIVVALGLQAYWDVAGANNGTVGQSLNIATAVVPTRITRANADSSSDTFNAGTSAKSANATVTTTGSASSIGASTTAVTGAVAYAWFWGAAGSETLGAVTTINSVNITAAAAGTQTAASITSSTDFSTSSLDFDGLLTIASKGLGSQYVALATGTPGAGTTLTAGSGRIVEIDAMLANFWDKYRLQPNEIHVSFRQFQKITNLILGSTNPNVLFTVDPSSNQAVVAGRNVGKYVSPITGQIIDLIVHPNMPPGTMFFNTTVAPAYVQGVQDIVRVRTRREYYQLEWPLRTRRYEYGVYADEVLQHFFPPAIGILTNVA